MVTTVNVAPVSLVPDAREMSTSAFLIPARLSAPKNAFSLTTTTIACVNPDGWAATVKPSEISVKAILVKMVAFAAIKRAPITVLVHQASLEPIAILAAALATAILAIMEALA